MKVELLAHSQLTKKKQEQFKDIMSKGVESGKLIAFTAIRNCYSANLPSEIIDIEGHRYLNKPPTDGGSGTDMDRLIRHIMHSGHTSTMEHVSFTFTVEGVSRALMAQITRHRVGWSFSIESQRYVNYRKEKGGFKYVIPNHIEEDAVEYFINSMDMIQIQYDNLIKLGAKPEDARAVLPQATVTNIVMTCNIASFLSFYSKRKPGTHAQDEIQRLSTAMKDEILEVEPWLSGFFVEK